MEAIQLIQMSPADLRMIIAEEVGKIAQSFKPAPAKAVDVLLTKRDAMDLVNIKSYSGFTSWCIANKVYGKQCGKRKMYLQSEILAAFQ